MQRIVPSRLTSNVKNLLIKSSQSTLNRRALSSVVILKNKTNDNSQFKK